MDNFKIGVMVDSFKLGFDGGLQKAKDVGARGIQVYAVEGEIDADKLTRDEILTLRKKVMEHGLEVSALCGDLGGHGFAVREDNVWKIRKSKRIVDMAVQLDCHVVTTHIGCVPADRNGARYAVMQQACRELGEYACGSGVTFAIETGPETAQRLAQFIADTGSKGIGVNLDPANLVMVTGDDPVKAVYTLRDSIVHTHAKDGIMVQKSDPEEIYNFFAEGGIGDLRLEDYFKEVPLGQGSVDFKAYLAALRDIGYSGYLTVEREVGANAEADIRLAVNFLKSMIQ